MRIRTTLLFTAILTLAAVGTSSAMAQQPACPTCEGDPIKMAEEAKLEALPLSLWIDSNTYMMSDTVTVTGHVANVYEGVSITIKVIDPDGNLALVDQLDVDSNGDFESEYAASSWSYPGIYTLMAQYGSTARDNKVQFELIESEKMEPTMGCGNNMLSIEEICIPYEIEGGEVTGTTVNSDQNSIVLDIYAHDDGKLQIDFPSDVIDDIFFVMVNGEEANDVKIDEQTVKVYFLADTENIEFVGSHVIPEFGTITALILGVSLVSIVVVSARSKLGLVNRF